ncbi:MAG: hypothetical protein SNJ59_11220 [Aggregatilineales bacterium]
MTTQVGFQDHHSVLSDLVRRWDRRQRWGQSLRWLPWSLSPGLAMGIVLALASRMRPWLSPDQILMIALALTGMGAALAAGFIWLRRRSMLAAARRFDVLFGLNERVSTALELLEGRIHANDELSARQIADARAAARAARVHTSLPLRSDWRAWALAGGLALLLAALLLLPNPQAEVAAQDAAQATAIEEAAETVRELLQAAAADPSLNEADRQQLLEVLQASAETLAQENLSPEEAFAAASEARAALHEQAQLFNQRLNDARAELNAAAEALRDLPARTQPQTENPLEELLTALRELAQNLPNLSAQGRQQAAQQLQSAAQALQTTSPQAAEALEGAAQALEQNDLAGAENQLQRAEQALEQTGESLEQQQAAADRMAQQAQQAQQASNQIRQSQSERSPSTQNAMQPQAGLPSLSDPDEAGQQAQTQGGQQSQQEEAPSQAQGDQAGPEQDGADQLGAGAGPQADLDAGSASGQPDRSGLEGSLSGAAAQASAGDGEPSAIEGQLVEGASRSPDSLNNPDGLGTRPYEQLFAPRRLGGPLGEQSLALEADDSDAPVIEGDFVQNPTGDALVPYNQVFSDYRAAVNQALESGYVPLGLRDVVREYFTSLEPR